MSEGWSRIESAPRDGTRILAFYAGDYEVVSWCAQDWRTDDHDVYFCTHWMPLPPPPDATR